MGTLLAMRLQLPLAVSLGTVERLWGALALHSAGAASGRQRPEQRGKQLTGTSVLSPYHSSE